MGHNELIISTRQISIDCIFHVINGECFSTYNTQMNFFFIKKNQTALFFLFFKVWNFHCKYFVSTNIIITACYCWIF